MSDNTDEQGKKLYRVPVYIDVWADDEDQAADMVEAVVRPMIDGIGYYQHAVAEDDVAELAAEA